MEKIKALYRRYHEVIMYLVFGVATTLVNWIVTYMLQHVFGLAAHGWQFTLTNAIAWVAAVLFAFFTNKKYVFESKTTGVSGYLREMARFFGARAATGVIEIVLPTLLVRAGLDQSLFNFESFWAKAVTSVIVIVLNYVFSKLFVFRKKKTELPTDTASSAEDSAAPGAYRVAGKEGAAAGEGDGEGGGRNG